MPTSLLYALVERRFARSVWPWRALVYAATTAIAAGLLWSLLACPVLPLIAAGHEALRGRDNLVKAVPLAVFGVLVLAIAGPPLAVALGWVERRRLRLADDRPAVGGRTGNLYVDPATWRAFAYLLILAVVAPLWLGAVALATLLVATLMITPLAVHYSEPIVVGPMEVRTMGPAIGLALLGVALIIPLLYLISGFAAAHAAIARALLCTEPDPAAAQLVQISQSRARLVDAFDAERRRIERDLHDGAQQRVVALNLQLGLARLDLPADSPAVNAIDAAQGHAKALMVELRNLIHGINPRTLTELGLAAALDDLAAVNPIPTTVTTHPGRLSPAVETVAYFAAAEALTNVAKHSGATQASVTATRTGQALILEVTDNGTGGADPTAGSGLTGLADRVATAGGRLLLSSPAGGPTVVRIELPCGS